MTDLTKLVVECNQLRADNSRLAQRGNMLAIRCDKFRRLIKHWHKMYRWCGRFSMRLQIRVREQAAEIERLKRERDEAREGRREREG
jgi:hypothetical protein